MSSQALGGLGQGWPMLQWKGWARRFLVIPDTAALPRALPVTGQVYAQESLDLFVHFSKVIFNSEKLTQVHMHKP